jgi:transposase
LNNRRVQLVRMIQRGATKLHHTKQIEGAPSARPPHYLRSLLVAGTLAVIKSAQRNGTKRPWLVKLLERRTSKIAAVAMANKIARMGWALMIRGESYREPLLRAA